MVDCRPMTARRSIAIGALCLLTGCLDTAKANKKVEDANASMEIANKASKEADDATKQATDLLQKDPDGAAIPALTCVQKLDEASAKLQDASKSLKDASEMKVSKE